MGSILVVLENNCQQTYKLDEKPRWEVGRPYKENQPDIKLYSTTVSRKHGSFQNIDGFWFYIDNHKINGTAYNGRFIDAGIRGRVKPVMLKDGDELIFGCGKIPTQCKSRVIARFYIRD